MLLGNISTQELISNTLFASFPPPTFETQADAASSPVAHRNNDFREWSAEQEEEGLLLENLDSGGTIDTEDGDSNNGTQYPATSEPAEGNDEDMSGEDTGMSNEDTGTSDEGTGTSYEEDDGVLGKASTSAQPTNALPPAGDDNGMNAEVYAHSYSPLLFLLIPE